MEISRRPIFTAFLLVAGAMAWLVTGLQAEVPRDQPYTKYRSLWQDSPFTAKPVTQAGPVYNPLSNYVLLGVSPIPGGHRVTLLNKRQPTEPRIYVETGKSASGLRIVEVVHKAGDPMATVVRMASGSTTGTVAFEEKFLKLPPAPVSRPAANQAGRPQTKPATRTPPRRPARAPVVQPAANKTNNKSSQRRFPSRR